MAKNDAILAAIASLANGVNERFDSFEQRLSTLESKPVPVSKSAPRAAIKTETALSKNAHKKIGTEHVSGTITYIARHGQAVQLDGKTGEIVKGHTFLNCFKDAALFSPFTLGDFVTIELSMFQYQDNDPYPRVTNVRAGKGSVGPNTTAAKAKSSPRVAVKTTKPVAGASDETITLGIRPTNPTNTNPDGCAVCGGTKHPKESKGWVSLACRMRQFAATMPDGERFNPHNDDHMAAYVDWMRSTRVTVATNPDGSDTATVGGKNAPTTAPAATTSEPTVKRGPGRPRKSDGMAQIAKATAPARPVVTTRDGKLLKVNNAGTKIQFQESGKRFEWLPLQGTSAHGKLARKLEGKSVTVTIHESGQVTDMVRLPKAAR